MNLLLKGWPARITDPDLTEEERNKLKDEFVKAAAKRGFKFSVNDVEENPGLKCKFMFEFLKKK